VVNNLEQQKQVVVSDDCPCHHGGAQTLGSNYVCPSVLDGIAYIQGQGETWYNNMVASIIIQQIIQSPNYQNGDISALDIGGRGIRSSPVYPAVHSIPFGGFLSWSELQGRFATIKAYANGTGAVPVWLTPEQLALFTSPLFCMDAQACFNYYTNGQVWIAGTFMALAMSGMNIFMLQMYIMGQVGLGILLLLCLQSAGWG
jgi:hypothetical protein